MVRLRITTFLLAVGIVSLSAAPIGAEARNLTMTFVDYTSGRAISGLHVELTSNGETITTETDQSGRISLQIPPGVYTVTVYHSGYSLETLGPVTVGANQAEWFTFRLNRPKAYPRPSPAATPKANPIRVHDSVLSVFNARHPEHSHGEPFYGRYTYVLLRDGDSSTQTKNRALVSLLVDRFVSINSTIRPGAPSDIDNPWGYNIFFLPVNNDASTTKVSEKSKAVHQLMNEYSYEKARSIRDHYCEVTRHQSSSVCIAPYATGPIILTFLRPIGGYGDAETYPPALAYDFSDVPPDQFGKAVDDIQRAIIIPAAIEADVTLPPSFLMKYVAPLLNQMAEALTVSVVGIRVFLDKELLKLVH